MTHIIAALLMTAALAAPASAADDPILARLVGTWTGDGTYRQSEGAKAERVFCKITNTLVEDGQALEQKGRCAVASNSGSVNGVIRATGGGKYAGTIESLASKGPAELEGTGSGDKIVLSMDFVDTLSGKPAQAVTTTELKADGYRLLTERKEGGAVWINSDIAFKAR